MNREKILENRCVKIGKAIDCAIDDLPLEEIIDVLEETESFIESRLEAFRDKFYSECDKETKDG